MKRWLSVLFLALLLLTGCQQQPQGTTAPLCDHTDADSSGFCDICQSSVTVTFDIFAVNDLHGKIMDGENHPGVDELSTYITDARERNENTLFLSVGDMWQGAPESNLTQGLLTTDWMNRLDLTAMAMGNHEYDWGEAPIEENAALAEFPFLAINIYDRQTQARVDYCESSILVDRAGVQIGIIGAIGDCYSSISPEQVQDVYFLTGDDLTRLVMEESAKLRSQGADFIIYLLHDGYGDSVKGDAITGSQLSGYYDQALSAGYVDLVFEGHTHQRYLLRDEYGVYHIQNKGENKGISHVSVTFNTADDTAAVDSARLISTGEYAELEDDPVVEQLLEKYAEQVAPALEVVGRNARSRSGDELRQLCADLYYMTALSRWSLEYDIVLAGGFMSVRSPWSLSSGDVTYGQLQSLFPFDNELVLCTISGRDLRSRFFETDNENYFICYGDYGQSVYEDLDPNEIYYIVTDTYSSTYAPNRLTEVERYGQAYYARDMLADYIRGGGMN